MQHDVAVADPTAVEPRKPPALAMAARGIEITTAADLMQFAAMIAGSDLAPKDYRGKPANVFVAVEMGRALGLRAMQSLLAICVINGRPSIYGDAFLALARASGLVEEHHEELIGAPYEDDYHAVVTTTRRGCKPHVQTFSVGDAKQAKLWKKQGPWLDYPKRMLVCRARAWAVRDVYGDVLSGLSIAEEVMDYPRPTTTEQRGVEGLLAKISVS